MVLMNIIQCRSNHGGGRTFKLYCLIKRENKYNKNRRGLLRMHLIVGARMEKGIFPYLISRSSQIRVQINFNYFS